MKGRWELPLKQDGFPGSYYRVPHVSPSSCGRARLGPTPSQGPRAGALGCRELHRCPTVSGRSPGPCRPDLVWKEVFAHVSD